MRVLLLTRYGRTGVTSRIRFLQYLPYLESHGLKVHVAPFLGDDYVQSLYSGRRSESAVAAAYVRRIRQLFDSRGYDLLWIEKELLPWIPAFLERLIGPYVVDYDDAVFHNYDLHSSGIVRTLLGRKIQTVMSRAITVVVGNEYLAEYARKAGASDIQFIPTVVDTDRYQVSRKTSDTLTVGWIGTPWTARYLPAVAPALRAIMSDGNIRVRLIGSGKLEMGFPIEVRPWSEETEAQEISEIDIGIMPLPDEPFERGKCGYKLLQYMACGRPVVASPVGANSRIVDEGQTGFLAGSVSEWIRCLNLLKNDASLRSRMGEEARKKVESFYSLQVQAPRILDVLNNARRASHPRSP
jgi:glycosyltransferase involved in cell wall biosynthesis